MLAIDGASVLPDSGDLADVGDIVDWIRGEDHQIGELAGFERAEVFQPARAAKAPFFVAATIACDGVIPSSTNPSIARIVPIP